MGLKVLPADEADAPRSIAIENLAYGPNPVGDSIYPGPFPPTKEGTNPRVDALIDFRRKDSACKWVKVVDEEIEQQGGGADAMVAFAMWYVWETPQPPAEPQTWGPGSNPEACELFFGAMREKRNARFTGKPFVYLKLLHTDPKHQRRGAASMLLQWGAEEADRLGLDSYLEASPEGKPLYEKKGFKEVDLLVTDFSKWGGPKAHPTALMMRPAASKEV